MTNFDSLYSKVDSSFNNSLTLLKIIINVLFGEKVGKFYSVIDDSEKFSEILKIFGEKSITFPSVDEFKSAVTLSLVYYYKEIMGFSWTKINELIPYERDVSLRYGSKIKSLQKTMKKILK